MFYAHSANERGEKHLLKEHLLEVARLAASFAAKFGAGPLGYLAGLLHDIGKIQPAFQEYLAHQISKGPEHSLLGALMAVKERYWEGLAFVVAGHHAGLPPPEHLKQRLQEKSHPPSVRALWKEITHLVTLPSPPPLPEFTEPLHVELFLRLLFSCLVDADFLDTERHFSPEKTVVRDMPHNIAILADRLWQAQANFSGREPSALNQARHEIYQACLNAAAWEPGIFRLTVPTGGGKTRSGLAFALEHARRHQKHRVIVALPYTSIIDQTVQVYREILGAANVLEHHSAVNVLDSEENGLLAQWARLAAENWDAPVIVTTTVQLFESLMNHKPAACRKLHNIVNSVLILDEVQTLPTSLLNPILEVLQQLVDRYKVTLVLSTATQPALAAKDSPYLTGLRGPIREIVPHPEKYYQALRRVTYVRPTEPWSWEKVAATMAGSPQCLAVVNTKKDALTLLEVLEDDDAFHLSTLLCMAHRREVLQEIRQRLAAGKPCKVVATQVVEAGVDLDFPLVLRALGPLDRIVQAAGRCNREGRLSPEEAQVIIFVPETGGVPAGDYRSGTDLAASLLKHRDADLQAPSIYERYFKELYQTVDTDKYRINELRARLNFPQVAERFRVIEDDTVPMLVRYPAGASPVDSLLAQLNYLARGAAVAGRQLLRHLQPYLVNVRRRLLPAYQQQGLVRELPLGLWEWLGAYHETKGLSDKAMAPDILVI